MKNHHPFYGVLVAALYGLVIRLIFGLALFAKMFDLFSITFLWITPILIGCIPFLYAPRKKLENWSYRMTMPALAVTVFFIFLFIVRLEDLICMIILLVPYVVVAMVSGVIIGSIVMKIKDRKGIVYSFALLPFLTSTIEKQLDTPSRDYSIVSTLIVKASPEVIWANIIRVDSIHENEYKRGFFNFAGIPRPLYAELDKDTLNSTRIGHFEGGLKFVEKVRNWERNRHISFDITVIPSTIRPTVFDQHILRGNHFRFLNAAYSLRPLANDQTELTLTSSFELRTTVNSYASFWGKWMLADFQERLLNVIKLRCEKIE